MVVRSAVTFARRWSCTVTVQKALFSPHFVQRCRQPVQSTSVFHRCRITAVPGNGFIRHIFRAIRSHSTSISSTFMVTDGHPAAPPSPLPALPLIFTSSGIATICRLHGDGRRPGRHCFQAFRSDLPLPRRYCCCSRSRFGRSHLRDSVCYQLTLAACQLQSGLIQRYTLHRHLAHLYPQFLFP